MQKNHYNSKYLDDSGDIIYPDTLTGSDLSEYMRHAANAFEANMAADDIVNPGPSLTPVEETTRGAGNTSGSKAQDSKEDEGAKKSGPPMDGNLATDLYKKVLANYQFARDAETGEFLARHSSKGGRFIHLSSSNWRAEISTFSFDEFGKVLNKATRDGAIEQVVAGLSTGAINHREMKFDNVVHVDRVIPSDFKASKGTLGRIVIDLGDDHGNSEAIIIENGKARIAQCPADIEFTTRGRQRFIERPDLSNTSYGDLWSILGIDDTSVEGNLERQHLIRGWLINALIADIERPFIMFTGHQGSGKSTAAAMVLNIVSNLVKDAQGRPQLGGAFGKLGDEEAKAEKNMFISYDNLSSVKREQSDHFARTVTGSKVEKRMLYTDNDMYEALFQATGVITAIELPWGFQEDALDRMVHVRMDRLDRTARLTGTSLWGAYNSIVPKILGAVMNDLAFLTTRNDIAVGELERMADYSANLLRIDEAMGNAFQAANESAAKDMAADNPFIMALTALLEEKNGRIEARAEDIIVWLSSISKSNNSKDIPENAKEFGSRMVRGLTQLELVGITHERKRKNGQRIWIIEQQQDKADKDIADLAAWGGGDNV